MCVCVCVCVCLWVGVKGWGRIVRRGGCGLIEEYLYAKRDGGKNLAREVWLT